MGAQKLKAEAGVMTPERYEDILEAVMQTARGRWFLEIFAQRNRTADTDSILSELARLHATSLNARGEFLRQELQELSTAIEQTRAEIAQIKPDGTANSGRILMATGELDAIVSATERATSDILNSAENIQKLAAQLRSEGALAAHCAQLDDEANKIFMACSFQDITGQRTTKVVNTLRYLEQRVNAMVQIWGPQAGDAANSGALDRYNPVDSRPDAALLHGPALEGEGVSQSDVDAFLEGGVLPAPPGAALKPQTQGNSATAAPAGAGEVPTVDQNAIDALFE